MSITLVTLTIGLVTAAAAWFAIRRRSWRPAAGLSGVAAFDLFVAFATGGVVMWVLTAGVLALGGAGVWVRWGMSRSVVNRWGARARRTSGVATMPAIARTASAAAMRKRVPQVRPSLADKSRSELRRDPSAYAVELGRVGTQRVYASLEEVVLVFGGPRRGKTGWMGGALAKAPGAVVTTSTRIDLLTATRAAREAVGDVRLFNPGGLARMKSDVGFDLLAGCDDPVTPTHRAIDMIPDSGGSERGYWDGQARRVLAAHLHAAALGRGRTMHHVLGWIADPDDAAKEVRALLRDSRSPAFVKDALQFATTNDKTRSSITSTIMPALQWLASPDAVAATRVEDEPFDIDAFIRSRDTVYLLGRDESNTAPLMGAFTGAIVRAARRLAGEEGGRLDPTLTLALDEAGRSAPLPLDDLTGDAGGSGICVIAAFQSRADIIDRWGPSGASKVLNNAGAAILLGGTWDEDDLRFWSNLAGMRDEVIKVGGSKQIRQVPVLAPAQLAVLPKGRAAIFRSDMTPVIGRPRMFWDDPVLAAAARAAAAAARREAWENTIYRASWPATAAAEVVEAAQTIARVAERDAAVLVDEGATVGAGAVPAQRVEVDGSAQS